MKDINNELMKLIKRANQRILRLERLTGIKESFGVKQLIDYASSEQLQAVTKSGRIRITKGMNETQMKALNSILDQFLNRSISTVKQVKKYVKEKSRETGKELSYKEANLLYDLRKNWRWILEYMTISEFIDNYVRNPAVNSNVNIWCEALSTRIGKELDEQLREDLVNLYNYFSPRMV